MVDVFLGGVVDNHEAARDAASAANRVAVDIADLVLNTEQMSDQ